ncbi:MAG: MFS transporter, partial [Steroidobacteraceae bacterium]
MRQHGASPSQLTQFHYRLFVACAFLILIDGYDGAVLTYAAPAIAANLKLDPATFGPLFAAHLVGTILGFGPSGSIADRRGRRPIIIGATLLFTVCTFATATASTFASILVYRLLTGVGLGAAASNTLALASEYSPGRCRATVVAAIYSALPMGAVVGGYVAVVLIRRLGWHSVFVLGGGLGIAALVIALGNIPESICFLRASGRPLSGVYQMLARYG